MNNAHHLRRREVLLGAGAGGLALMTGASRPARAQTPLRKINIVSTAATTNAVLGALIRQQGYFEEFGLDATVTNVSDGIKIMGALLSGEMDMCPLSGFGQVFPAIEKGAKMKIIGGGALLPMQGLISARPNIRTLKDLEGKTVGTGSLGALVHQMCVAILRKNGIDESKITFVNIGSSADVFRAVAAGSVDAGSTEVWQIGKNGVHAIENGRLWLDLPEYTYQAAFTSDAAIQSKRDLIVRALAAYVKLYRFVQSGDSKDAFLKAYAVAMGKADSDSALEQWSFYQQYKPFAADLLISDDRMNFMQDLNMSFKIQSRRLPIAQVADWTMARDAVAMLR